MDSDDTGLLWVATYGGGLICVDPERRALTRVVTVAEGLSSDLFYGCSSDGQGQLWLGTLSMLLLIVNLRGWSCQTCCAGPPVWGLPRSQLSAVV
jgi:ligand-binding sensor domain-containing protein